MLISEFNLRAPHPLLLMAWVLPSPHLLATLQWSDVDNIVRMVASICAVWLMFRQSRSNPISQTRRSSRELRRVCPACKRKG